MFFLAESVQPDDGKKRKGKSSRPLRIDLILQRDSLVPPPKESVSITLKRTFFSFYVDKLMLPVRLENKDEKDKTRQQIIDLL